MTAAEATPRHKTGLFPNLSRSEYEAIRAINVSSLEYFERSALHAREAMLHPKAPTAAMEVGTDLHCAVLEPERFSKEYAGTIKVDRRTTEGKKRWAEFEAEHQGMNLLDADEWVTITRMRDAVYAHPVAKQMLSGLGHNEVGIVYEHAASGLLCKSLLDRITGFGGYSWVIDLKKTQDVSRREFARSVKKFHYGAKAAFYLDGCNTVAPHPRRFAWIAVEEKSPHDVVVYEPDEDALRAGRIKYERWLYLYREAVRTNVWPGCSPDIQTLSDMDTEWRA